MSQNLTFKYFQDFIAEHYGSQDSRRGVGGTFMWLMEEVGELASALQASQGPQGGDPALKSNLEEEFADCLGWLTTLANMHGVDLEKALRNKYLSRNDLTPHKQ